MPTSSTLGPVSSAFPTAPAQALLFDLLEGHPEGIVYFDPEFRILFANAVARRISRILPEHIATFTHWQLYPQTLGTPVEDIYRRVLATRQPETVPDFLYGPFDTWYRVRAVPVAEGFAIYYQDVTEEHHRAEQQRATEERLSFAFDVIKGVGAWEWDIVHDLVYSDPNFASIYGVSPELAASGTPIANFTRNIHPDDAVAIGTRITEAVRTGSDFFAEYRLLQADGSTRWVSTRGRAVHDKDGKPLRFPGVAVDITEQKERDELLLRNEQRLRLVMKATNGVGSYDWDVPNDLVYADANFARIYGVDPERFAVGIARDEFASSVHPEDRAAMDRAVGSVLTTGGEFATEYRILQLDGSAPRWVAVRGRVELDAAGTPSRFTGVVVDITESKQRDEQLRHAAERLREQYDEIDTRRRELEAIYSGSPIGMALYETSGFQLIHINERQAEIFGLTTAEALGKNFFELTEGVPDSHTLIRRAAAGESVLDQNVTGWLDATPDEVRFWNLNYTPIFDDDGNVQAVASATIETTTQKRAETALIQAEKLAAVGRLASSIAHEINNPLESVTNLIFLARSQAILPEVQHFLDLAEQELRRVSVIANQTLRFHKQATRPTECSAEDLFDSTLGLYEGRLRNGDIHVERRHRKHPAFHCFEGDIRQVISNLVGNAIDALPRSGRLLVRSRQSRDWQTGAPGITLTIADTGTGIPQAALPRIFDAFYTTKGFNGTGLGLWVSADIVERHQGRLRVRSSQAEGHTGTVFTLFIPLNAPAKPQNRA